MGIVVSAGSEDWELVMGCLRVLVRRVSSAGSEDWEEDT